MRVPRTRSQGAQADELGQIGDGFQRAAAAWAQVIDMIGRRPVAPYARAAGRAFGMRQRSRLLVRRRRERRAAARSGRDG